MKKTLFLAKIKDSDERDVVNYIEFKEYECDNYFKGFSICGACFYGFEKQFQELVENNFDKLETILTKDDFKKLFNKDVAIKELKEIENKLLSKENEELFDKVIIDEKEFCKKEYNLTENEVDYIFSKYTLEYQDRSIISYVFDDIIDLVEEEKFQLGYDGIPCFDDEKFGKDLLESEFYLELKNGKIVSLNY